MKRRALMQRLNKIAKRRGHIVEIREGGRHTVVKIGARQSSVPRHTEINEMTAKAIIRHFEADE